MFKILTDCLTNPQQIVIIVFQIAINAVQIVQVHPRRWSCSAETLSTASQRFNLALHPQGLLLHLLEGIWCWYSLNKTNVLNVYVASVIIYTFDYTLLVLNYTFELHYKLLQCASLNSSWIILLYTNNPIKVHSV